MLFDLQHTNRLTEHFFAICALFICALLSLFAVQILCITQRKTSQLKSKFLASCQLLGELSHSFSHLMTVDI